MSAKSNSFDRFDILLFTDVRYMNTFRKSIADVWTLNVPFHVLHSTQFKISSLFLQQIFVRYNQYLIKVDFGLSA